MLNSKNDVEYLLADEALAQSSYQSLARLLPHMTEQRFAAGETIYRAYTNADNFYLLCEGEVKLISPQGRATGLAHRRFGEEAASDAPDYLTDAVASSEVTAIGISRAAMATLVEENPVLKTDLLFSLMSHLSGEKMERRTGLSAPSIASSPSIAPSRFTKIPGWLLCIILPLLALAFGGKLGLDHNGVIFLAILTTTVVMWVFSLVDDYIPSLFALLATLLTGLVPTPVILSGFASDGFMMALSTLALGAVVVSSGLGYRFMLTLLMRLPDNRFWHFAGLFLTGAILTPIIPTANGRITLVIPFYADMVDSLRLKHRGSAATRLAVACFSGISLFSAMIMTSKSVNFAIYGLLTPQSQDHFQWLTWLFASIVAAFVMLVLNSALVGFMFRNGELPKLPKEKVAEQLRLLGKLKSREWAAILGISFMIVGIITSSIHKVQPPWLGFAMLFGLLLCGTLRKKEMKEKVDWTFLLYLSGIMGIVAAFNYLGLDKVLSAALPGLGIVMRSNFNLFVLLLFAVVNLVRLAVPTNATVVILATIMMPLAGIAGVNSWVIGFMILIFSEAWFLPYQCSYYLQLQELNRSRKIYDEKAFLRFNATMNFARLIAVYASIPFWRMLGLI